MESLRISDALYVEIRNSVAKDIAARASSPKRHDIKADWAAELEALLGPADNSDKDEIKVAREKAAALVELAASRFSVFVALLAQEDDRC